MNALALWWGSHLSLVSSLFSLHLCLSSSLSVSALFSSPLCCCCVVAVPFVVCVADQLRLSWGKLRRESAVRWFGLSIAPKPEFYERFARQYRYSTRVSPDVAFLKLRSPSVGSIWLLGVCPAVTAEWQQLVELCITVGRGDDETDVVISQSDHFPQTPFNTIPRQITINSITVQKA